MPTDEEITENIVEKLGTIDIQNIIETQNIMRILFERDEKLFNHFVFIVAMLNQYIENDKNI
jgi:chorismate mutase|tara:strand:- start:5992 stop:6177 length:186 start_codon:yes stop_codon:yes gene_type:complete